MMMPCADLQNARVRRDPHEQDSTCASTLRRKFEVFPQVALKTRIAVLVNIGDHNHDRAESFDFYHDCPELCCRLFCFRGLS